MVLGEHNRVAPTTFAAALGRRIGDAYAGVAPCAASWPNAFDAFDAFGGRLSDFTRGHSSSEESPFFILREKSS